MRLRFRLRLPPPSMAAALLAAAGLLLLAALPAPAQVAPAPPAKAQKITGPGPLPPELGPIQLSVFTFRHQRASEALPAVRALLSARGSVALDEESNTLSVRESAATMARIARAVASIDHAPQPLAIDVQLIRAVTSQVSPVPPSTGVEAALLTRLKQVFRYDSYALVARGRIDTREGETVDHVLGEGYRLSFRPGALYDAGRLRLAGFAVVRRQTDGADREVVRTVVNLRREQPFILGLATGEASARALLLAMRYEIPAAPAVAAPSARVPGG